MPFIVTSKQPCYECGGDAGELRWRKGHVVGFDRCGSCDEDGNTVSRRAVAALEDAQDTLKSWLWANRDGVTAAELAAVDGSLIEAVAAGRAELMRLARIEPDRTAWSADQLIAAFNDLTSA